MLAAWAKSSLGVEVALRTETRFPPGGGFYSLVVGGTASIRTAEDARAAADRYRSAMTPALREQAEEWVWSLRIATAGAKRSDVDEEGTLDLYTAALLQYPADVAKAACMALATRPRDGAAWFPTLPELIAEADRLVAPRRTTLNALLTWNPETEDQRRAKAARDLMFEAAEIESAAFLTKRSDPDGHAAAMEKVAEMRKRARQIERREIEP